MESQLNRMDAHGIVSNVSRALDVVLVRHGQTDWNAASRIMGRRPVVLSEVGRAQARRAAQMLRGARFAAICTSPQERAVETAHVIVSELSLAVPVTTREGLAEFDMGDWVGERIADLRHLAEWTDYLDHPARTVFPGGESLRQVQGRCTEALNTQITAVEHGSGNLLVVTHGGIVRLLLLAALGMPLDHYHRTHVKTASISVIRVGSGRPPRVRAMNVTEALDLV